MLLEWSTIEAKLVDAEHYWLTTVTLSATPLARPVDGMWLDGGLYFGGHERSRWLRNLRANGAASVNLENAESAVIIEGGVTFPMVDRPLAERVAAAANAKYDFQQTAQMYLDNLP